MSSRLARVALIGGLAGLGACIIIAVVAGVVEVLTERNEQQTRTARSSSDHTESSGSHEMRATRSPRNQDSARNNDETKQHSPPQKRIRKRPSTANARDEENISVPPTDNNKRSSEKTTAPQVSETSQPGLEVIESEPKMGSSTPTAQQSTDSTKSAPSQSEYTEPRDAALSELQNLPARRSSPTTKIEVLPASPSEGGPAFPPARELLSDIDEEHAIPTLIPQCQQVGSLSANDTSIPRSGSPEALTTPSSGDEAETIMTSSIATITPFEQDAPLNAQEPHLNTTESSPESRGQAVQPVEPPPLVSLESDLPTHLLPPSFRSDAPVPEEPPLVREPPAALPEPLEAAVLPAIQPLFEYEDDDAGRATPRVTSPELSDALWFDTQLGPVVSDSRDTENASLILSPAHSSSSDEFDMVSPTSPHSRVDHEWEWTASEFGSSPPTEPTSPFLELSNPSSEDEDMYSLPSRSDSDESLPTYGLPAENTAPSLSEILGLRHQHDEFDLSDSLSEGDTSADESTDNNWSDLGTS